ncbi:MAG: DUF3105 domain-containing protein [Actinobacteria bacterium]|nr:DUF3105 domain-containing protein [Actinomycetota bacterium]
MSVRGTWWRAVVAVVAVVLGGCMPTAGPTAGPDEAAASVPTDYPVRLSPSEVEEAADTAGCTPLADTGAPDPAQHVAEDAPPAAGLYDRRPPTAGDHLGAWIEARPYDEAVDERAVVHNHEHGAVSVWYSPEAIDDDDLATLHTWAEARNAELANDAGAGIVVAPFGDGLDGDATVAYRAWTGGLDCRGFDVVVADGFLLERFGEAPEGGLAPDLAGLLETATAV